MVWTGTATWKTQRHQHIITTTDQRHYFVSANMQQQQQQQPTWQCLHSNMSLVRLRRRLQGISTQILSTRRITLLHPPTIVLAHPSRPPSTALLDGTIPCHEKTNDSQLECVTRSGNHCRGRKAFALSMEKHCRCRCGVWIDLGDNINLGWVHYFVDYGDCTDWCGSGIALRKRRSRYLVGRSVKTVAEEQRLASLL